MFLLQYIFLDLFILLIIVHGADWTILQKTNDVQYQHPDNIHVIDGGKTETWQECQKKADVIGQRIFTWYDNTTGKYSNDCWFRKDMVWAPRAEKGHVTGYKGTPPAPTPAPTPSPIPGEYDCKLRHLAMEYMAKLQPFRGKDNFQQVADALNGAQEAKCHNVTVPTTPLPNHFRPSFPIPSKGSTVYVSENGNDGNTGTLKNPFATVKHAVEVVRNKKDTPHTVVLRAGTYYLDAPLILTARDSGLTIMNYKGEEAWVSGAKLLNLTWEIFETSTKNIYKSNIKNIFEITGLRVNGIRAIRARFPNADPRDGFGSTLVAKGYLPVKPPISSIDFYPEYPLRNSSDSFERFTFGIGGHCGEFVPPAGYWCGKHTAGGGGKPYAGTPGGIKIDNELLPNSPYKNATGAVVQMWRPHHWASWMFEVDDFSATELHFGKGGFQGARGPGAQGAEFYIENVMEELDAPGEWYFNSSTSTLYYYYNGTGEIPSDMVFEATSLKNLVTIQGSMKNPAKSVWLKGVGFKDTRITYLDPHEMPSGGDWALQRTAAVELEGTVNSGVDSCFFFRLDGNAVMLSDYNRNATITKSEFAWIGDNVIGAWGRTTMPNETVTKLAPGFGWDGREGTQPRYSEITYNFVHEIGLWEKQSSFFFQAKSCLNHLKGNVFFNGPRAGINFNDGFGGAANIEENLLFNTCRESGDHGPFNSWDRQVYITDIDQSPSIKQWDNIHHNFVIANYHSQEAVDNDDGSAYYNTHDNFFSYSGRGMKNDFGGHDNHHHDNIYAFIGMAMHISSQTKGHEDHFYNNKVIMNNKGASLGNYACSGDAKTVVYNISIFTPDGKATECGKPSPISPDTTVAEWPNADQIISWARKKLDI